MTDEWGPWIEHDGRGCPVRGMMVEIIRRNGSGFGPYRAYTLSVGNPTEGDPQEDNWVHLPKPRDIIRYRVRRPKALQQLIQMVENLPAPSKQYENA